MNALPLALSLSAAMMVGACSDTEVALPSTGTGDTLAAQARLKTLDDSEAFFSALKEALINYGGSFGGAFDEQDTAVGAPIALPSTTPSAQQGAADSGSESGSGAIEVTSTNVQEQGVDEQDRVKVNAAGTQLFVLNSEYTFDGEQMGPIDTDSTDIVLPPLDTSPGMQEVSTTLRILELDSETPDANSIIDLSVDLNGQVADGFYLYESDNESSAIISSAGGGFWGYWDQPIAFSGLQSTFAKVDIEDAANASLTETFTVDGQIISSRRIGDSLFFASRYYPVVPGTQQVEPSTDEWIAIIDSADLAALMPQYTRSGSDETTPLADAAACFVAPVSTDQSYYSPDIIVLGVIDLASMELRDSKCFLGATETLYASTESVFLATTQYSYSQGPMSVDGDQVDVDVDVFDIDTEWFDPRTSTDVHQFDIESDQLTYAGSGSVQGHLGWNPLRKPFRMSESGDYLRVATMNDRQGPEHSPILMHILQADGQGVLRQVSRLPNEELPQHIGEPGEQLYASRFVGDRAYLVTFRQTDPLYVVDLADPAKPAVKGELKIDGYSDYLHPITDDFLLGIGKDAIAADDEQGDGRGAWVQGIKLSLFDVSDPANPAEVQSLVVGERGTDSVALSNHRAITIQAATELHPTRVSFGIDVFGELSPAVTQGEPFAGSAWNYTGLHGFDVTVGDNASIAPQGVLIVDSANESGRSFPNYGDDRSVMVNDAVFYVNESSVYPALWNNLDVVPNKR